MRGCPCAVCGLPVLRSSHICRKSNRLPTHVASFRSGKTFTMVGAPSAPGITPRALKRLFGIVTEERSKGTVEVRVEAYMVELYLDSLEDLFWRVENPRARQDDAPKLEIKKDDRG